MVSSIFIDIFFNESYTEWKVGCFFNFFDDERYGLLRHQQRASDTFMSEILIQKEIVLSSDTFKFNNILIGFMAQTTTKVYFQYKNASRSFFIESF